MWDNVESVLVTLFNLVWSDYAFLWHAYLSIPALHLFVLPPGRRCVLADDSGSPQHICLGGALMEWNWSPSVNVKKGCQPKYWEMNESFQCEAELRDYSTGVEGCRYLREFKQNPITVRIREQTRLPSLLPVFPLPSLSSIGKRGQQLTVACGVQNQCWGGLLERSWNTVSTAKKKKGALENKLFLVTQKIWKKTFV